MLEKAIKKKVIIDEININLIILKPIKLFFLISLKKNNNPVINIIVPKILFIGKIKFNNRLMKLNKIIPNKGNSLRFFFNTFSFTKKTLKIIP